MKKLALVLVSITLAACASNQDPVNGPMKVAAGQKANDKKDDNAKKNPEATPAPEAPVAACVVLNGSYVQKGTRLGDITITASTKTEAGVNSYSFDGGKTVVAADGKPHPVQNGEQKGSVTETCDATSVTVVAQIDGAAAPMTAKYTAVGDTQLKVEGDGDAAAFNGTYTKQQ